MKSDSARTPGSDDRSRRMAALLDEAFETGVLAFAEPLLDAGESVDVSGLVRSEHGAVYDIERELGHGGMATVYLAHDTKHDRPVALKVLHSALGARVGAERFVREIRVTARLQHPHALGLLDSGVFDPESGALAGLPYYVMPYVDGQSLRARLHDGALPVSEAVRFLRDVADALAYSHDHGVVHRDIKPENILLSRGHAVVADFGIAKALAAAGGSSEPPRGVSTKEPSNVQPAPRGQSSSSLGTPAYMAPEQVVLRSSIDHRADLYSWGVVAYEVLTGRHPFDNTAGAHEFMTAQMAEMPRPIRDVRPGLPTAVAAVIMRCLSKMPDHRPASAAELLAALDQAMVPERHMLLRRVWIGVSTAVGAALAIGAALYWRSSRVEPPRVVHGTGNAAVDVAAVQAAVLRGGEVILEGRFSFRVPATKPIALSYGWGLRRPRAAQVLVSRAVTISGTRDAHGDRTTIDGGTIPFYVDAPGKRVAIRGLRFVKPTGSAILVRAVDSVVIAYVRIDGVEPIAGFSEAIAIRTSAGLPVPTDSGSPGAVSGTLTMQNDTIDASGSSDHDCGSGVIVFGVGQSPGREVDVVINGNQIRNTTGSAIVVRRASGRVRVTGNTVVTSPDGSPEGVEAIRLVNTASYLMANNVVECRWAKCVGIAVFSQFGEWPLAHATIEDNAVIMSPPPGTVFGDTSAAIEIKGFADSSIVRRNTLRGRARAGLAIHAYRGGSPADNAFIDNRLDGFHGSLADIVVGGGVVRTRVVRPGRVIDQGERTVIER